MSDDIERDAPRQRESERYQNDQSPNKDAFRVARAHLQSTRLWTEDRLANALSAFAKVQVELAVSRRDRLRGPNEKGNFFYEDPAVYAPPSVQSTGSPSSGPETDVVELCGPEQLEKSGHTTPANPEPDEAVVERAIRAGCAAYNPTPCPQADVPDACPNECVIANIVRAALAAIPAKYNQGAVIDAFRYAVGWLASDSWDWSEEACERLVAAQAMADAELGHLTADQLAKIGTSLSLKSRSAAPKAELSWRCFHCDEVFTNRDSAAEHFGAWEAQESACQINIAKYREMEEFHARNLAEDTEKDRQYYRMRSEHATALQREEEKGYARGLADGRTLDQSKAEASDLERARKFRQRGEAWDVFIDWRGPEPPFEVYERRNGVETIIGQFDDPSQARAEVHRRQNDRQDEVLAELLATARRKDEQAGRDEAIRELREARFEPVPKPTIEELEVILNSPAPAVRINPDGSIGIGSNRFEAAADYLATNRPSFASENK